MKNLSVLLPLLGFIFVPNLKAEEVLIEVSCFEGAVRTSIAVGEATGLTALQRGELALKLNEACEDGLISFNDEH